jgi:hypothetical protein
MTKHTLTRRYCPGCKTLRANRNFYIRIIKEKNRTYQSYRTYCKPCDLVVRSKFYHKNLERSRAYFRKYYWDHPKYREYHKAYIRAYKKLKKR